MERRLEDFLVPENGTLLDAAEAIDHNHSRCAIVISGAKVVGLISEGDILRALLHGADVTAPVQPFVRRNFKFLARRDETEALRLFSAHGFSLLPVLDRDFQLRDVIVLNDLLKRVRLLDAEGAAPERG
ncbi:MAG: CBS domain-containing protein [Azospirillum sp.]|nr:CBS domain-containing protein [Azospirillum sp.]